MNNSKLLENYFNYLVQRDDQIFVNLFYYILLFAFIYTVTSM